MSTFWGGTSSDARPEGATWPVERSDESAARSARSLVLARLFDHEHAFLVGRDDIEEAVAV
jgi:hypothetical protein